MTKSMLILKASSDVELCETRLIAQVAEMYQLTIEERELVRPQDLADLVNDPTSKWDIVYACGHGDHEGIGDEDGVRFFRWEDVATALCDHLNEDAWFFLGCCRSGLAQVSYAMFCGCSELAYVFGPRWEADDRQLACAFHALLHNFYDRGVEPVRAAKRASKAIDLTIRAFDRGEVSITDSFLNWCAIHGTWPEEETPPEVLGAFEGLDSTSDPVSTPTP
jgi:hypothetical protein